MTPSFQAILESKRKLRRELASRPIAEKLKMLDALRSRELQIRERAHDAEAEMPARGNSE